MKDVTTDLAIESGHAQVAETGTVVDIGMAAAGTGMEMAIGTVGGAADIGAVAGVTAGVVGVPVLALASG